jgi:hypothetical protein
MNKCACGKSAKVQPHLPNCDFGILIESQSQSNVALFDTNATQFDGTLPRVLNGHGSACSRATRYINEHYAQSLILY